MQAKAGDTIVFNSDSEDDDKHMHSGIIVSKTESNNQISIKLNSGTVTYFLDEINIVENPRNSDHICSGNVEKCFAANRFVQVMQKYNRSSNVLEIDIIETLDDFLYLQTNHNDDKQFEYIFQQLGYCNIKTCNVFTANKNSSMQYEKSRHQILNKIHMFYYHCYDVGHRLSMKDKETINHCSGEEEKTHLADDDSLKKYIINTRISKINRLLGKKKQLRKSSLLRFNQITDIVDQLELKSASGATNAVIENNYVLSSDKTIIGCDNNDILHLIETYIFGNLRGIKLWTWRDILTENKAKILDCIRINNWTGKQINEMTSKEFACNVSKHCSNKLHTDIGIELHKCIKDLPVDTDFETLHVDEIRVLSRFENIDGCLGNLMAMDDKRYSYGIQFEYGYEGDLGELWCYNAVPVCAKYSSLKEELLKNRIATLLAEQFNTEYEKAEIHFHSKYCKNRFGSCTEKIQSYKTIKYNLSMHHILSLMVYCNYTELQYKFSQSYRAKGAQYVHKNFYYLGKYLKIAVQKFGTLINKGNIDSFYHGIGQRLLFPKYIDQYGTGIIIHGPLSTSSSFVAATNFTNNNNGLVLKFVGVEKSATKYFSVGWLSDYPSESEHLFIQNNEESTLEINNIYDVQFGYEYECILNALKIINKVSQLWRETAVENQKLDLLTKELINSIVYDIKLSLISSEYAKQLINVYRLNKKHLKLNCSTVKKWNPYMYQIFCNVDGSRVKWKVINDLFPDLKRVAVKVKNLTISTLENLVDHLKGNDNLLQMVAISGNVCIDKNKFSPDLYIEDQLSTLEFVCDEIKTGYVVYKKRFLNHRGLRKKIQQYLG
eukprot:18859_1